MLQDILTIHGSQFCDATCIVASPPCQLFSYTSMPWSRAKALKAWYHESPVRLAEATTLFDACFRIQLEASKAAGRYIPMVVENVCGAQCWVGPAKAHYGSFYLWGDVDTVGDKIVCGPRLEWLRMPRRIPKVGGLDWSKYGDVNYKSRGFNVTAAQNYRGSKLPVGNNSERRWEDREVKRLGDATKTVEHVNKRDGFDHTRHLTNQRESDGVKQHGSGAAWFDGEIQKSSSKSDSRKAASAQIAKIPLPLSRFVAQAFRP